MTPVSPVMPGSEPIEVVIGKDQPEYDPLPAVHLDTSSRAIITRWRPSEDERKALAEGADVVLQQLTFRQPFHPVNLQVCHPNECPVLYED